jgi:hypothetical protein
VLTVRGHVGVGVKELSRGSRANRQRLLGEFIAWHGKEEHMVCSTCGVRLEARKKRGIPIRSIQTILTVS